MSEEEINKFLLEMMNDNSQYVYCHQHIEREEKQIDKDRVWCKY